MTCPAALRTDAALDAVDVLRRVLAATARRLGRFLSADVAGPVGTGAQPALVGAATGVVGLGRSTALRWAFVRRPGRRPPSAIACFGKAGMEHRHSWLSVQQP